MDRFLPASAVVAAALLVGGCATVKPWERHKLADPVMQPEIVPESVFVEQHFVQTREASAGGYAVAGGGCGCN